MPRSRRDNKHPTLLPGKFPENKLEMFSSSSSALSQGPATVHGRYLRGPGPDPALPGGDVHLLHRLLHRLPLLLRQHLRRSHHHHISRAGRVRIGRGGDRQEPSNLQSSEKQRNGKLYDLFISFQKSCIDFAINATPLERYMPEERVGLKYRLWRIVESTPFEYFIMTLIVLNTILLMMKVNIGTWIKKNAGLISLQTLIFSTTNSP